MGLEKAATFVALDKLATAEATAEAALVIEAETQERAAADLEVAEAAKKAALDEQAAALAAAAVEAAEAARDAAEKADTAEKLGAKKLEDKRCAIGRQIKPSTLACTRTRTRTRHAHASRARVTRTADPAVLPRAQRRAGRAHAEVREAGREQAAGRAYGSEVVR